jgi:hypothetical protein
LFKNNFTKFSAVGEGMLAERALRGFTLEGISNTYLPPSHSLPHLSKVAFWEF